MHRHFEPSCVRSATHMAQGPVGGVQFDALMQLVGDLDHGHVSSKPEYDLTFCLKHFFHAGLHSS